MLLDVIKKITRVMLIFSMILNVIMIFYHSSAPPEKSKEQSSATGNQIAETVPPETTQGSFIQENLRDIAHFAEYGILAVQAVTYIIIFSRKRALPTALAVLGGVGLAFFDEMVVQRFSGRSPDMHDVMLDTSGFVTMTLVCYLIAFLYTGLDRLVNKK